MKNTIGIFSRCGKEAYECFTTGLKPENVRPFYISNYNGREFNEEVSRCSSAILYHSKKRGRVNIVDVVDSLYDKELKYLSSVLGKENVIVVVDDLEESGPDVKQNILINQPSIKTFSKDLCLFTTNEKRNNILMKEKVGHIKSLLNPAGSRSSISETKETPVIGQNPWRVSKELILYVLLAGIGVCFLPYIIFLLFSVGLIIITALAGSLLIYYVVNSVKQIITWQKILLVIEILSIEALIISINLPISLLISVIFTTLSTGVGVRTLSLRQ